MTTLRRKTVLLMLGVMTSAGLCACSPPTIDWESADSSSRVSQIVQVSRDRDMTKLPRLVRALRSDDALVRMTAGDALVRLTGEDLGYRYYETESKREAAVKAWESWLAERRERGNTSAPQTSAPLTPHELRTESGDGQRQP